MKKIILALSLISFSAFAKTYKIELQSKELGLIKGKVELLVNKNALVSEAKTDLRISTDNGQVLGYWCETRAEFKNLIYGEIAILNQSKKLSYTGILSNATDADENTTSCENNFFPEDTQAYLIDQTGFREFDVTLKDGSNAILMVNVFLNHGPLRAGFVQDEASVTLKSIKNAPTQQKINFHIVKKSNGAVSFLEQGEGKVFQD